MKITKAAELEDLRSVNANLLEALKNLVPLAQAYLRTAPSHPDNGKIADALEVIAHTEASTES